MSNSIEKKLEDLMNKLDLQMLRDGKVDRATFEEFTLYHKLYQEKRASLRQNVSSEED